MLQFLKGQMLSLGKNAQNRLMLVLEVQQTGYEIQVPARFSAGLNSESAPMLQVFVSLQVREEQPYLYGFTTLAERDLFNQLLSVSGIGAQLALALIDTLGLEGLVQAVVTGNINQLCQTPGVGKKTAERLALELKSKLSQWRQSLGLTVNTTELQLGANQREDLELTLLALGYTDQEIHQALGAIRQETALTPTTPVEEWIRQAILWLSQRS
ncbi:Holliday junction branch migration protein RuvA [Synechocystis sp. LKSZ1]|uniref:Holliday junction branch migration protein RuvA n=1 Tax=Synechocystis sp. LKSZ1 TaxID=3144951 RepID=UPI00336C01DD